MNSYEFLQPVPFNQRVVGSSPTALTNKSRHLALSAIDPREPQQSHSKHGDPPRRVAERSRAPRRPARGEWVDPGGSSMTAASHGKGGGGKIGSARPPPASAARVTSRNIPARNFGGRWNFSPADRKCLDANIHPHPAWVAQRAAFGPALGATQGAADEVARLRPPPDDERCYGDRCLAGAAGLAAVSPNPARIPAKLGEG